MLQGVIPRLVRASARPISSLAVYQTTYRSLRLCTTAFSAYSTVTKKKKPLSALDGFRRSTNNPESAQKILKLLNKSDTYDFNETELSNHIKLVTAITVSDSIKFSTLIPILEKLQLNFKVVVPDEVINVAYSVNDVQKHLVILSNGTLIGWNFNELELLEIIPEFTTTFNENYTYESDEFDYVELAELPPNPKSNGHSYMINDIILIQNINESKKMLDKIAFSIALSRSTRIAVLENNLEEFLKVTRNNSDRLANGHRITSTEHEVLKMTGKLFLLRGKLNLYNELIDTPDLYWSEPTLEKIYQQMSQSLDINSRISILNRKLDYATEEQRVFLSLLNEKKSTSLEWTIIILILIEVGFETYRFLE